MERFSSILKAGGLSIFCLTGLLKPSNPGWPEIQVVSRDRASAFADAVSQVLPHATQIADRYHLVQNLREHLQRLLDHKRSCLPFIEDKAVKSSQTSAKEKADSPADLVGGANSDSAPGLLPSEQQGGTNLRGDSSLLFDLCRTQKEDQPGQAS